MDPVDYGHVSGLHFEYVVLAVSHFSPPSQYIAHKLLLKIYYVSELFLISFMQTFTTSSNPFVGQARMDGSDVLWSLPRNLPPLVHPPFIEKGLKLGVGGRYLSECVAHQRGYMIHDNNGTLEIRIPFGAEGGFIKVSQRSYALSV